MIEVIGLHKQFAENILYNGYNVRFCAPKICIEAPNGQGKTTLLMMLAGLETYESGELLFSGNALTEPHKQVAIASDSIALPDFLTAKQIINLSSNTFGCCWPTAIVDGFNFNEFLKYFKSSLIFHGNLFSLPIPLLISHAIMRFILYFN